MWDIFFNMSWLNEHINPYITKIQNLVDIDKLRESYESCEKTFVKDDPSKVDFNAICINRRPDDLLSITAGNVRGLYWTMPNESEEEVQRLQPVDEHVYTEMCPEFKGTFIEEVYKDLTSRFKLGRMRFLMKPPRSCLSWHRDPEKRLHIPIITSPGCRMIIEDTCTYMPADGSAYITDNTKYHNFFNGSEIDRVHLVATLLEE